MSYQLNKHHQKRLRGLVVGTGGLEAEHTKMRIYQICMIIVFLLSSYLIYLYNPTIQDNVNFTLTFFKDILISL